MKRGLVLALTLWSSAVFSQDSEYEFFSANHVERAQDVVDRYQAGISEYTADSLVRMNEWYIRALHQLGRYELALTEFEALIDEHAEMQEEVYYSIKNLKGLLYYQNNKRTQAIAIYEELLEELPSDYDSARASVAINFGWILWNAGEDQRYYEITKLGITAAQRAGDVRREQLLWLHLAEYYEKVSYEFDKALSAYERSDNLSQERGQETELRLSLRRAVQLRDIKRSYEESVLLLQQIQAEASVLGISWLYEQATSELLRSTFVSREQEERREIQFFVILGTGIAIAIYLIRQFTKAKNTQAYMREYEDRLKAI